MTDEDGTERSETSPHKTQTQGNRPKERIQHSGHGYRLKSRICLLFGILSFDLVHQQNKGPSYYCVIQAFFVDKNKKVRLLEGNRTAVCLKTQPILVQWLQVINISKK